MNKWFQRIRVVAVAVGLIQIVFSVIGRIWVLIEYKQYSSSLDSYSWSTSIFTNISGMLSTVSSGLILILLALFLNPDKIKALFNKPKEELPEIDAASDEEAE